MLVTSTSSSIGNYASAARSGQGALGFARLPDDAITEQLRASLASQAGGLKVGSTITATYAYRVGEDGHLYATQTQITTRADDADADGQQRPRRQLRQDDAREQRFADVLPVKPQLTPVDEIRVFGFAQAADAAQALPGEGVDATGKMVDVTILPPGMREQASSVTASTIGLAARAQAGAANLYARNNDIVFSLSPLANLAA